MRTTVDLEDHLFRRAKSAAALHGLSLKELITRALKRELEAKEPPKIRRVRLPLVPSKRPGRVILSSEDVHRLLDAEDRHGLA